MRRPGSRSFAAILTIPFAVALAGLSALPAAGLSPWLRPVAGRVTQPFRAPVSRFGPGHLGVDFAAPPGTAVRAAGAGTVAFAGVVAGAMHVVISHPGELRRGEVLRGEVLRGEVLRGEVLRGGLRTSYSFLASIRVHRGEEVSRGEVLGTTGGGGEHHDGSVVHIGLRVGETYVDPMRLLGPPDLAAVVHLAPLGPDRPGMREVGMSGSGGARARSGSEAAASPPPPAPLGADPMRSGIPVLFGRRTAAGRPLYPR